MFKRSDKMTKESNIYTGQLMYENIVFSFVFNGIELRLIPSKEKEYEVAWEWKMKPICNGVYTLGDPQCMEEPFLIGKCNENGNKIVFITKQGSQLESINAILFVKITAYIVCKYDRDTIDRISFSSPEINCIHPINKAFNYTLDIEDMQHNGVITISTKSFETTTTEKQTFIVDEKSVKVYFGVSRGISTKIDEAPLSLNSSLMFEFEPTNDYSFILRLWNIAKCFIQFLCYRKNTYLPESELSSPYENGKHERFATLYVLNEDRDTESEVLSKWRYIKQQYIAGHEGKFLTDIAANTLYTRHIPETYKSGRHIDAARFVMITAAFEWEFMRAYPEGVKRSLKDIEIEKEALTAIQKLIDGSTGKLRDKYKFLKKLIRSNSMQSEIVQTGKDFGSTVNIFGNHLYELNKEKLEYSEMGQRLSSQRNNFAHGNLDKEFIGLSLLDVMFMEYILYAMQLSFHGVDYKSIQKALNDLFRSGLAI
jgi:hypothetical protein